MYCLSVVCQFCLITCNRLFLVRGPHSVPCTLFDEHKTAWTWVHTRFCDGCPPAARRPDFAIPITPLTTRCTTARRTRPRSSHPLQGGSLSTWSLNGKTRRYSSRLFPCTSSTTPWGSLFLTRYRSYCGVLLCSLYWYV